MEYYKCRLKIDFFCEYTFDGVQVSSLAKCGVQEVTRQVHFLAQFLIFPENNICGYLIQKSASEFPLRVDHGDQYLAQKITHTLVSRGIYLIT